MTMNMTRVLSIKNLKLIKILLKTLLNNINQKQFQNPNYQVSISLYSINSPSLFNYFVN